MSEANQRFDTFTQWCDKAPLWLTRRLAGHKATDKDFRAICFDSTGRHCSIGRDFSRANMDNAFPVYWLWPDQVGEIFLKQQKEKLSV